MKGEYSRERITGKILRRKNLRELSLVQNLSSVKVVTVLLIIFMSATTFHNPEAVDDKRYAEDGCQQQYDVAAAENYVVFIPTQSLQCIGCELPGRSA
jgi:hypothetical protein